MREEVAAEYAATRDSALKLATRDHRRRSPAQFRAAPLPRSVGGSARGGKAEAREPATSRCGFRFEYGAHRLAGYRIVTSIAQARRRAAGRRQLGADGGLADIADAYSQGEVR